MRQIRHAHGQQSGREHVVLPRIAFEVDAPFRRQALLRKEQHCERDDDRCDNADVQRVHLLLRQKRRPERERTPSERLNKVADAALDAVEPGCGDAEAIRDVAQHEDDEQRQHGVSRVVASRRRLRIERELRNDEQ